MDRLGKQGTNLRTPSPAAAITLRRTIPTGNRRHITAPAVATPVPTAPTVLMEDTTATAATHTATIRDIAMAMNTLATRTPTISPATDIRRATTSPATIPPIAVIMVRVMAVVDIAGMDINPLP